jgi:transposase
MLHITLGADDLVAVAYERYHHPEPIVQRKMTVLWLKHQRLPHHEIARLADVSRASVTRYLKEFSQGGLDAIRRFPWKGRRGQLDDHQVSLEEHFRQHPPRSLRQAQQIIEQQTGLHRGLTQVRRFLLRLGLKPRKVAAVPLPPKSTLPEHVREQRRFLDNELEPQLREARAGLRDVYFVDASHFVFGSFLGYVWCFVRLCIRAASGRKRYNGVRPANSVLDSRVEMSSERRATTWPLANRAIRAKNSSGVAGYTSGSIVISPSVPSVNSTSCPSPVFMPGVACFSNAMPQLPLSFPCASCPTFPSSNPLPPPPSRLSCPATAPCGSHPALTPLPCVSSWPCSRR